jgi:cell division protein FtsW (lipid II flippase)
LALARYLAYRRDYRRVAGLIPPLLLVVLPMGLILVEPDLGTSLVLIPALFVMLYMAGASLKHLSAVAAMGAACAPVMYFFVMGPAQRGRITAFLSPDRDPFGAGWHLRQSLAAVASGGATGEGFSSGAPVLLNRGFAAHTDFIFAVIAHEWGFVGGLAVILLLFLFFSRGLEIAGSTREPFGRLLVVGFLTMLAFQALVNVGMTLRLCPITGITLPFISYGGSSLLVCFVMAALVLNVGMRRKAVIAPEDFA